MAVTLVVFINDIDTLHKGLYQRYQHIRLLSFAYISKDNSRSFISSISLTAYI